MSASGPRICVVTRTKDRPLMLKRAVESLLKQSFQNWLHVIVNDGGDPAILDSVISPRLGAYGGRVKIINNAVSLGMQNASNCAIREAESEYIAIHDDDDSWAQSFLSECVEYLDSTGPSSVIQGVATQSVWIFEEIDTHGNIVELRREDYFPFKEVSLFNMAGKNIFPPIAFVYRRKVHDHIGLFDQQFNYLGDWDFNIRFLSKFDIGVIDRQLAFYHWRKKGSLSSYGNTVTDEVEEHLSLANKLRNHYLRMDLEKNRIGLGFVINLSEKFIQLMDKEQALIKRRKVLDWDAYDSAYHFWKEYKKKRMVRAEALKRIDERYGLHPFFTLYPLYKIAKPFRNLIRSFKKWIA
ncbi:MAG: glycosyltransferase family 2 protein [Syntrophobacteraceae bacterium]